MKWFDIKNRNYWRVSGTKEYTIQEVADLTGITVRSLRNYIKGYETLLSPKRGYYNSLVFSEMDVRTFVMIKTCIKDGFRYEDIVTRVLQEQSALRQQMESENQKRTVSEPPVTAQNNDSDYEGSSQVPAETEQTLSDAALKQIAQYFVRIEQRNALLENRLERMEKLLLSQKTSEESSGLLPRAISLIKESSQAFWQAFARSL